MGKKGSGYDWNKGKNNLMPEEQVSNWFAVFVFGALAQIYLALALLWYDG